MELSVGKQYSLSHPFSFHNLILYVRGRNKSNEKVCFNYSNTELTCIKLFENFYRLPIMPYSRLALEDLQFHHHPERH